MHYFFYKNVFKITLKPVVIGSLFILVASCTSNKNNEAIVVSKNSSNDIWWNMGRKALDERLAITANNKPAKNIIVFIGDGMGISTLTAARIYDGQSKGMAGEENLLSFERFPNVALVKTYNTNAQVPDSAGTASAINTGVKTRKGVINLWSDQAGRDCRIAEGQVPATIAEIAEQKKMATGMVTTTSLTNATPAAVYGHSPSRGWENDADLPRPAKQSGCKDLADQMLGFDKGDGLDVMFGGGRAHFLSEDEGGKRKDKRNLINEWKGRGAALNRQYIGNAAELRSLASSGVKGQLLGLFADSHMAHEVDRDNGKEPSLSEMTVSAINRLSTNSNGFFLMVEGGRIDHAHHKANAYRALTDTQEFNRAVMATLNAVDLQETLILVTADHSHGLTINGYPRKGNDILGLVHSIGKDSKQALAKDGKPYTTLGYHTGPHSRNEHHTLSDDIVQLPAYRQQAAIPLATEVHTGEDVALFAIGPQSHLVGGVIEQHVIFHIIAHTLGWSFEGRGEEQ